MIGAIIGDIIGSRFEFNNYRKTDFELFHPSCRFTDDTVCTVAVADWILNVNEWNDPQKFARHLQSWCKRYPINDYGRMFKRWIENPVPYNSFGNGAAMRISPVAYRFSSYDDIVMAVNFITGVSHNHPEGIKGALTVVHAIKMAMQKYSKENIKIVVQKLFGYDVSASCSQIRRSNRFDETCQVTVPQSIIAFLESKDFESAIRLAVSIGGDSDTIAAITGSIAEAYYGIPIWIEEQSILYLPEEMKNIIQRFKVQFNHEKKVPQPA